MPLPFEVGRSVRTRLNRYGHPDRRCYPIIVDSASPLGRRIGAMTTEVRAPTVPIYLAGEFVEAGTPLEVRNPATDELVATTFQAGAAELERATVAAVEGIRRHRGGWRATSAATRSPTSRERISEHGDELAELLTPRVRQADPGRAGARSPVARSRSGPRPRRRSASTGSGCRSTGRPPTAGRSGIVRRYPIGPVAGISPFNFPLNLAAHKVAPAMRRRLQHRPQAAVQGSAGHAAHRRAHRPRPTCRRAPSASCPWTGRPATRMVGDDRFKLLSFTGSPSRSAGR